MKLKIIVFLLFIFNVSLLKGQECTVMFYNVENLFDTVDDTTKNDEEFLPGGSRRWTVTRYLEKRNSVARAVAAAGKWDLPAVIGLCEVENRKVLEDIAYGTILSAGNYGIVHRDSPDRRGIDAALLYRRDLCRVTDVRAWIPEMSEGQRFESRNLLYVKTVWDNDTLHFIMCHFPSRRGGVLAASELRKKMAELLKVKADSLMTAAENVSLLIMGDFNAGPDDEVMKSITDGTMLRNASVTLWSEGKGSYKFRGKWEMIDQIIVSSDMAEDNGAFRADINSYTVVDDPFLLTEDKDYPGNKPFAAYSGYKWAKGYSDHLPVIITLKHR